MATTRQEETTSEPRKIGEVISPALTRLDTSDQARAYGAWARAAGETVTANARPRSFARGVLTVECASSIWANELTYLGGRLLERMSELDPAQPVERFRFVVRRAPAPGDEAPSSRPSADSPGPAGRMGSAGPRAAPVEPPAASLRGQGKDPRASKISRRDEAMDPAGVEAAARGAANVGDERLRRAILAALATAAPRPSGPAPGGSSVNHKK